MKWPFRGTKQLRDSSVAASSANLSLNQRAYPAMENSAFWGCMTKLCRLYATMPWKLYEDGADFPKEIRKPHPIKTLMNHPAPYLNSAEWRFVMGFQFELFGQGMAVITEVSGTIVSLLPVSPNLMTSVWKENRLYWRYSITGEMIPDEKVLRFVNTGISYDAVLSLADYATRDIDTIRQGKDLQRNYYKNGASIGGILTVPKGTSKAMKEELAAMIKGNFSGVGNASKTLVIDESMKYEPLRLEEGDISKLEAVQKLSREEVYTRFFGPDSGATYANAEDRGIEEMKSVLPRFIIWETAFDELLPEGLHTKFNLNSLLRANSTTQMNCLVQGVNNGIYTTNEARRLLDYPPVPGGDIIRIPLNYGILNPDGSIDNPNQQPSGNPFDWPSEKKDSLEERRRRDLAYLHETQNVSKTNRAAIEKIMRNQVKDYSQKVRDLMASGIPFAEVGLQFETYAHEVEKQYGNEYVGVFKKVLDKLVPIIKKATKSTKDLDQDALDSYSGKFGQSMSGRFATNRVKELKRAESEEEMENVMNDWFDRPSEESIEETNRAGNAFQVFLFGQYGLQYMHVVASPDSCEFCQELDGKVVEVNGNILTKGDRGTDGAGNVRTIHKNYKHPPFHTHCSCGVAPGR